MVYFLLWLLLTVNQIILLFKWFRKHHILKFLFVNICRGRVSSKECSSIWNPDVRARTLLNSNKHLDSEEEMFMEPAQTFDYCHSSTNVDKSLKEQWIPPARSYLPSYERYNEPYRNTRTREYRNFDEQGIKYTKVYEDRGSGDRKHHDRSYRDEGRRDRDDRRSDKSKYDKYDSKSDRRKYVGKMIDEDLENISGDDKFDDETDDDHKRIKTEDKMPIVTMIEDLLSSPGREKRPPRLVIIMRGPPGSGKTFLAKLIKDKEVSTGCGLKSDRILRSFRFRSNRAVRRRGYCRWMIILW